MPTFKKQIDDMVSRWGIDFYDPKEVLIRHIDNPKLFEFLFPDPKPPREEQIRLLIEALLS